MRGQLMTAPQRFWEITDTSDEADAEGRYLLACVEAHGTLFVLIGAPAPAPDPAPELKAVVVQALSGPGPWPGDDGGQPIAARYTSPAPALTGETLLWRGQGSSGDGHDDLTVARFARPGENIDVLDITIDGVPGFAVRLARVR